VLTDSILSLRMPMVNRDTTFVVQLKVNDGEFDSEIVDVNILIQNVYPLFKFVASVDGKIINPSNINYRIFKEVGNVFSEAGFNFKISGDTIMYTVEPGNWIIIGNPLTDSAEFLPTYVGDKTNWDDAEQLVIEEGEILFRELNCLVSEATEGTYSISGYVFLNDSTAVNSIVKSNRDENKQAMNDVMVYLFNEGIEIPVKATYTNEDGLYRFDDLLEGDYFVQVNIPGYSQSEKYEASLNNEISEVVISFGVNTSSGVITDVLNRNLLSDLILYPNPTKGEVTIVFGNSSFGKIKLEVFSIHGARILEKEYLPAEHIIFNLSNEISGLYFVKISIDEQEVVKKLILDKK